MKHCASLKSSTWVVVKATFRRIMATYRKEHMAVSHEIKSQLAKLLATEDLVVEHKKIKTAQFNVHTRVLTLPMWEKASNTVYDLLVGHEVGHALYTPDEDPPASIPHQFVNVVEDCLLYTSPSPRDRTRSRMPSSA